MKPDILAVYFPSYHPDAHYEKWYGKGFSEWNLMRGTAPLFEGHHQPLVCEWGDFDESDPAWMERQIDLAADHGITGFMFDWYWYNGEKFLDAALERGFLRARNRSRLRFCVMWANHTWGVWPAARDLYKGRPTGGKTPDGQALAYDGTLLPIRHSPEDMDRVTDYCIEHYFREPNYITVDGQPLFCIWYPLELERQLGSPEAVSAMGERMKARCRKAGLPGLHISINVANVESDRLCWRPDFIQRYRGPGVDSAFGYNVSRTKAFATLPNERPIVPYDDVMASHREIFRWCEDQGMPFHPVATVGFDNTPRWHRGVKFPIDFRKLGYEPIVTGNTPEKFGALVKDGLDCIRRQAPGYHFLLLNAWNEWTEGCYLLPEKRTGNGFLEAVRDAVSPA